MNHAEILAVVQAEYRFQLTQHAWERMSGRGIAPADIDTIIEFGRELIARGAVIYSIGKHEVMEARKAMKRDIAYLEGSHVVCTVDGIVLTTYKNRDFSGLRERRPRPNRKQSWRKANGAPQVGVEATA